MIWLSASNVFISPSLRLTVDNYCKSLSAKRHSFSLHITYIESSEKCIEVVLVYLDIPLFSWKALESII
jgi:hypothetical protein